MSVLQNSVKIDWLIDKLLASNDQLDDIEYYDQRIEELNDQLKNLTKQYHDSDNTKIKKSVSFQIKEVKCMIKEYENLRKKELMYSNFENDRCSEELIFKLDD